MPQHKSEKKKETAASHNSASLSDEKSSKLLFVDSLDPIEMIVSFASLSRWYDLKLDTPEKFSKTSKKGENFIEHDAMSITESNFKSLNKAI